MSFFTDSEPAAPKRLNHCVKILLFGSLGFWLASEVLGPDDKDTFWEVVFFLLFIVGPLLAVVSRNLHALFAAPHLRLSLTGISLRYWRRIWFLTLWRFHHRIIDCEIPWSQYAGCRTYTHSVNGIPDRKDLIIETSQGSHVIGWDVFRPSVHRIQAAMLDFIETRFRQPAREEVRSHELCRRRFQTPLVIAPHVVRWRGALQFLGAAVVSGAVIAWLVPGFPATGWTWIPVLLLIPVIIQFHLHQSGRGTRHLELRAEGLVVGPKPATARVIGWDDIQFARIHRTTGTSGSVDLEIRLRDGTALLLETNYERSLDELQELIDPPVDKAATAWALVMQGRDPEAAAVAAGLPKR